MTGDTGILASRVTHRGSTEALTRRIEGPMVDAANAEIIRAALDGELPCPEFAMGFAAALDMAVYGTVDLANSVGMVLAAWRDFRDTTTGRRVVTDALAKACGAIS